MEGLRDIKDIVVIHEYSLWMFLSSIVAFLLVAWILYYLYKNRRKRRKKFTKRELALKRLKEIDFENTKDAVYIFSVDGALFTNEENIDKFRDIEQRLQKYKYQKDIPPLGIKDREMIKEFIKGIK